MTAKSPQFIWERVSLPHARRKLDYESIVRATITLADSGGLSAVSMRNVAAKLDVGTMSLYRYVTGKDDLLDLILDAAYGEIKLPQSSAMPWRQRFRRIALDSRRVLKRHPWLGPLLSRRPTLGPNYLRWFENLLAATASPDRDMKTRVRMIGTVWSYISGFIAYELGEMETNRRHNLTEARKRRMIQPYVAQITESGNYPCLAEFLKSDVGEPTDEDFLAGLNAVLKGIELM